MRDLVGRSREIALLRDLCDQTSSVGGAALLFTGAPGSGKSALLAAGAALAEDSDCTVLWARAVRGEATTALALLGQLLLPLQGRTPQTNEATDAAEAAALAAAFGFADAQDTSTSQISRAVLALLGTVSTTRAVLLVVDDLQWADQASREVLQDLLPRLGERRVGFVGATRPTRMTFAEHTHVLQTVLAPLHRGAAETLVLQHFPRLAPRAVADVLDRGRGNPLALTRLPRLAGGAHGHLATTAIQLAERRLRDAYLADLRALPAETTRLLLLLALEETGDLQLCLAAEQAHLAPAEQIGLLTVDHLAQRSSFTHPLIPAVLIECATGAERRNAHQDLAHRLDRQPGRQAPHLAAACVIPDEAVASQLAAAASAAADRADFSRAVSMLQRAASLSETPHDRAHRMVQSAYLNLLSGSDPTSSTDLLARAATIQPDVASSPLVAAARCVAALNGHGDLTTAQQALIEALQPGSLSAAPHEDLAEAARVLLDVSVWTRDDRPRAALAALSGRLDPVLAGTIRLQLATLLGSPRPDAGTPRAGWETSWTKPGLGGSRLALTRAAECALHDGDFARYRAVVEKFVAEGRQRGGSVVSLEALCCLAYDAYLSGEWDYAGRLVDEGLTWCDQLRLQLCTWKLRRVQVLLDAGRGDPWKVAQTTRLMVQWAGSHGMERLRVWALHAGAVAAIGAGEFKEALHEAEAAFASGTTVRGPEEREVALCGIEAAARAWPARRQAATQFEWARPGRNAPTRVALSAAAAAPAFDQAPTAQVEALLSSSAARSYPFDLARAHLAHGERLRRARATTDARTHLRAALGVFERLHAQSWAERTRNELDASGTTRNQSNPTVELTPQQRTVAALAAAGYTNKQIAERLTLTPRTVSSHLHQVFPKLGVGSRAALRDAFDLSEANELIPAQSWLAGVEDVRREHRRDERLAVIPTPRPAARAS